MQYFRGATAMEVLAVRIDAGEDLLAVLGQVIAETQIAAGAILSGTGTLAHLRLEVDASTLWPPAVYPVEKSGPAQIVSMQGHVVNWQVELFLTAARRNEVYAGRVMPETRVLHTAEVTLLRAGNARWTRTPHPETGVPLLQVAGAAPVSPISLMGRPVDPAAIALVPRLLLRKHGCLPVARSGDTLVVAMTNADDLFALDDLRQVTGLRIQPVVVPANELGPALQQIFSGSPEER